MNIGNFGEDDRWDKLYPMFMSQFKLNPEFEKLIDMAKATAPAISFDARNCGAWGGFTEGTRFAWQGFTRTVLRSKGAERVQ
ncbi:MAG: hypothetical protein MZW92_31360 [Comamonadaceae bacterium]|nr:hypothetical protein [Comamonadaceae bacterium]